MCCRPARAYESWDGTFFAWTYPEIFFQMRRPIIEPEGEPLEVRPDHDARLADRLGLCPRSPRPSTTAAKKDRLAFGMAADELHAGLNRPR